MNNPKKNIDIKFTFFGTSNFSVYVLDALKEKGLIPSNIVTTPDKPQGRNLILTPSPVKVWAMEHNIPFIQPEKLREKPQNTIPKELFETLQSYKSDVFIVASYGNIIPQEILDIPSHKTLNVHPSLLPKLRGASPLQSAILHEEKTGVTIMRLDDKMDHGPIVAQENVEVSPWPPHYGTLEKLLGVSGGHLLANTLPAWIAGEVVEQEQNHNIATYTKKIEKIDGEINLADDPQTNLRKIYAFEQWPNTYFFVEKQNNTKVRVIIKDARINEKGELEITRIIPEGKKEMNYRDFLKGL